VTEGAKAKGEAKAKGQAKAKGGAKANGKAKAKGEVKVPFVAYPELWWDCTDQAVRSLCLDIPETQSIRPNVVSTVEISY